MKNSSILDCSIMTETKLVRATAYLISAIFVLVPFQALLTSWLGSNFGHTDLFRIWKELLLVLVAVASLYLVYADKKLKHWFANSPLILLTAFYMILQFGMGIYALQADKANNSAVIYALLINLRFLIFLIACIVVSYKTDWLRMHWQKFILWPAAIVIVFGLIQHFILPINFLTHFGYGPKTIPAYQLVDQQSQYVRVQSTLRGANPLGAYLLMVLTIAIALFITKAKQKRLWGTIALITLVTLYFTYSRSAWLGALASGILVAYWLAKAKKTKQNLLLGCLIAVLFFIGSVLAWQRNSVIENTLFHTSQSSQSSESSNAARTQAMLDGAKSVVNQPLGDGPGTAGPASTRNPYIKRIAENYYIQIGQEVGVMGMVIFAAINIYLGVKLWANRRDKLALIALAALIGLTLVNMLSHAWTDDTLAYIYWGLAGIALAHHSSINPTVHLTLHPNQKRTLANFDILNFRNKT